MKGFERLGKVWKGVDRFGKVWKGLERFGIDWIRLDMFQEVGRGLESFELFLNCFERF